MKTRRFGRTDWEVSEVGYGMWGMGSWTGSDDDESLSSLQASVALGCNFFDTAWAYGEGKSEGLLGQLVRSNKDKRLFTATKIPPKNFKWPSTREYPVDACFPPDHIEASVVKSLRNADLESFDLIQFHTWEDLWLKEDHWIEKVMDLKRQGMFRAFGISINRWEPWNGIEAVYSGFVDSVQVVYNIFDQAPEDALFPACRAQEVAVIARVPFDEGTLTGTLTKATTWPEDDWRNSYFRGNNLDICVDRAEALQRILPDGISLPDAALRFNLSHPDVCTVIPGMRKRHHVEFNMRVGDSGPLDEDLIRALRKHRWDRDPGAW